MDYIVLRSLKIARSSLASAVATLIRTPHSEWRFAFRPTLTLRIMPTNIESLPYELICRIVELSVEETAFSLTFTSTLDARYRFLSKLSRTSIQLRDPAQAVLWASVRIDSQVVAHKWLASTVTIAERYPVNDLELRGVHLRRDGVTAYAAVRIIARCRGVHRLELHDFGRMSSRILQEDALFRLKHLVLLTSFSDKPGVVQTLSLPFQLVNLQLYNRQNSPVLIEKLFAASSSTLQVLDLSLNDHDSSYSGLVGSMPLIAKTLRHLGLNHRPTPELVETFKLLTSLTNLECHTSVDVEDVLGKLPAPLKSLTVAVDYNLNSIVEQLEAKMESPALRQLQILKMSEATLSAFHLHPTAEEFRSKYAKRGMEIKAQGKWD